LAGEPFRRDLLVKGPTAGLMSTMLSTGMRAVAIDIDSQGATKRWFHPAERSRRRRAHLSRRRSHQGDRQRCRDANELSNVRVLSIGQNVQNKNGEAVVVGSNATLELVPKQAR